MFDLLADFLISYLLVGFSSKRLLKAFIKRQSMDMPTIGARLR